MKVKMPYIAAPAAVFLVLWLGGVITRSGMNWYNHELILSSMNPPAWVFSVVWSLIGFCTALSLIITWQRLQRSKLLWRVIALFFINGLLNIAWTYFFFRRHDIGAAWWVAVFLELTTLLLIGLLLPTARMAAVLLFPYALWTAFALYLNYDIWLLNKPL